MVDLPPGGDGANRIARPLGFVLVDAYMQDRDFIQPRILNPLAIEEVERFEGGAGEGAVFIRVRGEKRTWVRVFLPTCTMAQLAERIDQAMRERAGFAP